MTDNRHVNALRGLFAMLVAACSACGQTSPAGDVKGDCARPGTDGCVVSMFELVSNPDRYVGERVSFVAFYAPALGRPTLFVSKDRWLLLDTPSAIVVPEMDEAFQLAESQARFSYVRASGVVGMSRVLRMEPHIALHDATIQLEVRPEEMASVERALVMDSDIGLTEEEYGRVAGDERYAE